MAEIDFSFMAAIFCTIAMNSFIMHLNSQNMGLDTLNVEISALWAEI